LLEFIEGDIAEGGLVLTVDLELALVVTVLLLVELVTIGSAACTTAGITIIIQKDTTINMATRLFLSLSDILTPYSFINLKVMH
jgi:hypothetical protein